MPAAIAERQHALYVIGLALAACEKSVQIVYEKNLRPSEKIHTPWVERVTGQLLAAYDALELAMTNRPLAHASDTINQAGISVAVAWHFTQQMMPEIVSALDCPRLQAFSIEAENISEFIAAPHGAATYLQRVN